MRPESAWPAGFPPNLLIDSFVLSFIHAPRSDPSLHTSCALLIPSPAALSELSSGGLRLDRRAHKLLPCRGLMERTLLQRRETSPIRIAAIQDSAAITDTAPTRGSERPARKPGSSHTEFDIIYFWYEPKPSLNVLDLSRGLPRSKDTCAQPPASRRCMHHYWI